MNTVTVVYAVLLILSGLIVLGGFVADHLALDRDLADEVEQLRDDNAVLLVEVEEEREQVAALGTRLVQAGLKIGRLEAELAWREHVLQATDLTRTEESDPVWDDLVRRLEGRA